MKIHEMTEWDAGQILVKLSDDLTEAYSDLARCGYVGHANVVDEARKIIAALFNAKHENNSHAFGL